MTRGGTPSPATIESARARFDDGDAGFRRRLQQALIEVQTANRTADHARRIPAPGLRTARPGDEHAANRQSVVSRMKSQPRERGEGARVERVATQLLAGKRRAVEQPDPQPGAREHNRRDTAGGSAADHDHIV